MPIVPQECLVQLPVPVRVECPAADAGSPGRSYGSGRSLGTNPSPATGLEVDVLDLCYDVQTHVLSDDFVCKLKTALCGAPCRTHEPPQRQRYLRPVSSLTDVGPI